MRKFGCRFFICVWIFICFIFLVILVSVVGLGCYDEWYMVVFIGVIDGEVQCDYIEKRWVGSGDEVFEIVCDVEGQFISVLFE